MDFKAFLTIAAVAAAVVWASNNVTAVRRIIGR
jgi:hypothetical protein